MSAREVRHVLEAQQFNCEFLEELFCRTDATKAVLSNADGREELASRLRGKIMIPFFGEKSLRTRVSFQVAAARLGMDRISTVDEDLSSMAKGPTLEMEVRVLAGYHPDVIVLRRPEEGASERAAAVSEGVPIINAGDGCGQHPTQALLDVYTIWQKLGRLNGLKIVVGGDLLRGRTVHSLLYNLAKFAGNEIIGVSSEEHRMKRGIKQHLKDRSVSFEETEDMAQALGWADVVYWTRTQIERSGTGRRNQRDEEERLDLRFIISEKEAKLMRPNAILMHPLPIARKYGGGEIQSEVDDMPQAIYYEQSDNGVPVRIALFEWVFHRW